MPTFALKNGIRCWRGQVKRDGKIIASKWFGSSKKEQRKAILFEERIKTEYEKGKTRPKTHTESLTIHEWATTYLDEAQRRFASKTYKEKRDAFRRLLERYSPSKELEAMTPGAALHHLQGEYDARSGYAANKDRKNLATAWTWGGKYLSGFPERTNPFLAVDKFPEVRKPRYVPPEDDFWAVLDIAEGQDHVMLMAFLHLAARRGRSSG